MKTVDFTGTVSQATMRPQDVLPACMFVLAEYWPEKHQEIKREIVDLQGFDIALPEHIIHTLYHTCVEHADCDDPECTHPAIWQSEDISFLLNETIWDAMQDIAPPGFYFGAHPGDGCDYGFWRIEED